MDNLNRKRLAQTIRIARRHRHESSDVHLAWTRGYIQGTTQLMFLPGDTEKQLRRILENYFWRPLVYRVY